MHRTLLFAIACVAAFSSQAQDSNNINSDNTGFTMSPQTVGKKALQIEAGYNYFTGDVNYSDLIPFTIEKSMANAGALKLRYGTLEWLEISAQYGSKVLNYRLEFITEEPRNNKYQTDYFDFAVKGQILKGSGLIPAVGASVEYHYDYSHSLRANLAAESRLFEKMGVRMNLGYSTEEYFHIAGQVNFTITDHWMIFGEYSNNFGEYVWIADLNDLSYYQPSNVTAGVIWNLNSSTLFGLSGTYYLNANKDFNLIDEVQIMGLKVSFNKRFDLGK